MRKILACLLNIVLSIVVAYPLFVSAEETYSDDPYTVRDTDQFYQDENGEYSVMTTDLETNELNLASTNKLQTDTLIHNSIFINTKYHYGIDVSQWQGTIDWETVKEQGVEFAFIRVGYRGYLNPRLVKDKYLDENLSNAIAAGVKVGVYFYSKAITVEEAIEEADFVIEQIANDSLDLPIMLDVEYDNTSSDRLQAADLSKEAQTEIVQAFINRCKEFGYSAGIYASASFLKDKIDGAQIAEKDYVWVAHWVTNTNYSSKYTFWQYSDAITLDGVSGNSGVVDTDVWYDDGTVFNRGIPKEEMYRVYNPNSGEHFYTSNTAEKDNLVSLGWSYEGIGWYAPTSGNPVYRLYNANGGEHHYTLSVEERNNLINAGWKYEGIGWYSANANYFKAVAVYREYNPNAFANNHNYTSSAKEHSWLIGLGWKDEGIGWYGIW